MGCNNTKLMNSSEGEGLPAKIRPILRQRIEEFRKRRNVRGGEEGDLSKKELLKGDDHDHDHDHDGGNFQTHHSSDHENEVVKETETQPPKEQTVVRAVAPPVEKLSQVVPFPWPASESETPDIPMRPQQEKDVENKPEKPPMPQQESKQEEGNPKHDDHHDDEDDDDDDDYEDDEDEESEFGRSIGPGSPSFRIYCIEAEKRKEKEICDANARYIDKSICHQEKEKEKEQGKVKETIPLHKKSHSSASDESATSASASGNEVVEMKPAAAPRRKRHKMKNLKKNLNILHVKHIPINRMMACTGSNDRRSHLADK